MNKLDIPDIINCESEGVSPVQASCVDTGHYIDIPGSIIVVSECSSRNPSPVKAIISPKGAKSHEFPEIKATE